jgi:large subunit ribosomal protein L11
MTGVITSAKARKFSVNSDQACRVRRKNNGKEEGDCDHQVAVSCPEGHAGASRRPRPRSSCVSAPQFVQQFNDKTKGFEAGLVIPVVITVYQDKSFTFILKTPPAAVLIKKALGLQTASGVPNKQKVGKLTQAQLTEIAQTKMPDLNANDIEAAKRIIAGTARSMGVE